FVEPVEYLGLIVALKTPGRCIVIEGPSGIGKTTAALKAVADAGIVDYVLTLSARKKEDLETIAELPSLLPLGVVLIDDFHRLEDDVKRSIADLMKTLADEGATHSKLIVLGITNAGASLISFGKDLANRIEIIRLEANPEDKIHKLITLGETHLTSAYKS
ncbi:MAG: ATP-binding protein, partial [Rhodomicrobium sp.]